MLPKPSTMKWVAASTTTVGWSPANGISSRSSSESAFDERETLVELADAQQPRGGTKHDERQADGDGKTNDLHQQCPARPSRLEHPIQQRGDEPHRAAAAPMRTNALTIRPS